MSQRGFQAEMEGSKRDVEVAKILAKGVVRLWRMRLGMEGRVDDGAPRCHKTVNVPANQVPVGTCLETEGVSEESSKIPTLGFERDSN